MMAVQGIAVRKANRGDQRMILQIEDDSFGDPWSDEDFERMLAQPYTDCIVAVARRVVGFAVYSVTNDVVQLVNMAVDPDYRKRGAGTALVNTVKTWALPKRPVETIVHETFLPAQLFLRSCGFKATGIARSDDGDCYCFSFLP